MENKELKQEKEDSKLLAELLLDKQGYFMKINPLSLFDGSGGIWLGMTRKRGVD